MRILVALVFVIGLQACSTFYYGHSKNEWQQMSETERELAKVDYQRILAEQKKAKFGDAREKAFEDFKDRATRGDRNNSHSRPDAI